MHLASIGWIQARAYTSNAQLPLSDVAVVITATDGTAIALRLTNRSGLIDPIEIPVPPLSDSQRPGAQELPFAQVNLYAYLDGFGPFESRNVQVFADNTTFQDVVLIPLSQLPGGEEESLNTSTPPQNL